MAQSRAWRSLSGNAVKVYVELRSRYNGGNNGDLSLSLDEGARLLGIGKATVQRSFAELDEKGFIRMTQRGGFPQRLATTWALTDEPTPGAPATHDYRNWSPK